MTKSGCLDRSEKQNNEAVSGVVVGGAHGAGGDGPGGEHHRLPEGPSGP